MACYHPLRGYRSKSLSENGKRSIVFSAKQGYVDLPVSVPCGQCIGCRLERSRQWAMRCTHESTLYEDNCFITLTYDDKHLPADQSVNVRDFQLFMKRLRKRYGKAIRFFHCGEYGENFARPHYHACIFNHDFYDKKEWKQQCENTLYTSGELCELWPNGFSSLGAVTFESAAYVARYITKKVTGPRAAEHYKLLIVDKYGEISAHERKPEYTTMSRRPGIGKGWFDKWRTDVYPSDNIIMNGRTMKPPKYYDDQHEITYPSDHAKIRSKRIVKAKKHADNNTPDRLKVREIVQHARLQQLKRTIT